jgi:hypothetical protein
MPYRNSDRIGAQQSEHRISAGGSATWLGAGAIGVAFVPLFGWLAFHGRHFSPKLAMGAVLMGALAVWAFKTWWELRSIGVSLHAGGIRHRSSETIAALPTRKLWAIAEERCGRPVSKVLIQGGLR